MVRIAVALALLGVALLAAGQAGLLRSHAPADLGVHDGRLKAPSTTPNSVSSQADLWPGHPQQAAARIAPLPLQGPPEAAMNRLRQLLEAMPEARIVSARPDYLHVEFTTRWLQFVDDAEFWADPAAGAIQLRSASRLGRRDMGVNRARIEALRARWAS